MSLQVVTNPSSKAIQSFYRKHPQVRLDVSHYIERDNVHIVFHRHSTWVFLVFHVPEYIAHRKSIESVELNIFYDRETNKSTIFAFDTEHFFTRYSREFEQMQFQTFGSFLEKLLDTVLTDESRIIEHILLDVRRIKKEYSNGTDATVVIRHLTNSLINISSLKMIVDNQDKLIEKAEKYVRDHGEVPISDRRTHIREELTYAKEFCQTLMDSIDTKYQVKQAEILYAYTKYTFIFFLAGASFQVVYGFVQDSSPIKLTFWIASLITFLGTLVMFRRFR
jgi:hypothetical protein